MSLKTERILSEICERLYLNTRFRDLHPFFPESFLDHIWKTSIIALYLIDLIREDTGRFDAFSILSAVLVSHIDEAAPTETSVSEEINKEEKVLKLTECLPLEMKCRIFGGFNLQKQDSIEGEIFRAIIEISEIFKCLGELATGNKVFLQLLKSHCEKIQPYLQKFASLKRFYEKDLESEIRQCLAG